LGTELKVGTYTLTAVAASAPNANPMLHNSASRSVKRQMSKK
jgi:hypothetical protein